MTKRTQRAQRFRREQIPYVILLLIMVVTGLFRFHLLEVPFERDEGEYAYAGQLIQQGVPPYQEVYNMKFPGIYALYALFLTLFGATHQAIHFALLLTNLVTILLIYLLGTRILNQAGALTAAAAFAALSLSQSVMGIHAHATHFVMVLALAGLLILHKALENRNWGMFFTAGFLLGLAITMKQHGAAFTAFAVLYVLYDALSKRPLPWQALMTRLAALAAGLCLVFLLLAGILLWQGVFEAFLFWTFQYAARYIAQIPAEAIPFQFMCSFKPILASAPLLWLLTAAGCIALFSRPLSVKHRVFLGLFALFSIVSIIPGFYFRPHYFVLLLPWAALSAGAAVHLAGHYASRIDNKLLHHGLPAALILLGVSQNIHIERDYLFHMNIFQVCRSTYWLNPFYESERIAEFIQKNTRPDERIAIAGSEPQIFFYAHRRSASGYIYMYPLMEKHPYALSMQEHFIKDIEAAKPRYMIVVNVSTSWLVDKESHQEIFRWLDGYLQDGKSRLVGLVELEMEKSIFYEEPALKWPAATENWVALFERTP